MRGLVWYMLLISILQPVLSSSGSWSASWGGSTSGGGSRGGGRATVAGGSGAGKGSGAGIGSGSGSGRSGHGLASSRYGGSEISSSGGSSVYSAGSRHSGSTGSYPAFGGFSSGVSIMPLPVIAQGGSASTAIPETSIQGHASSSGTSAASRNATREQILSLEQNKVLKAAIAQNAAADLPSDVAKGFLTNDPKCRPSSVDGNWSMLQTKLNQDCVEKVIERNERAKKYAEILSKPPTKECVKKLGPNAMVCQARKVMSRVVEEPYYQIVMYGNVVQLVEDGRVKMMGVVEKIHYDIAKKDRKMPSPLKKPTALLEFNELGGLLKQKGKIPDSKGPDPCPMACIEALEKKAAVEGQNEGCGGCESLMEITTVQPGVFKDASKKGKDSSSDDNKKMEGHSGEREDP